jgi:hypothetical protein
MMAKVSSWLVYLNQLRNLFVDGVAGTVTGRNIKSVAVAFRDIVIHAKSTDTTWGLVRMATPAEVVLGEADNLAISPATIGELGEITVSAVGWDFTYETVNDTGSTINIPASEGNHRLIALTPMGDIASTTLVMPAGAFNGQQICIRNTGGNNFTAITHDKGVATTLYNGLTELPSGKGALYVYAESITSWVPISIG